MNILDLKRKLHPYSGYMGGGSTTSSSTQTTELPAWLKTYAEEGLKTASELSKEQYQPFEGDRIAGFSPMQIGAQEAAAKMTPSTGTQAAMGTTGQVAGRALGADYGAGQFQGGQFGGAEAQQYMNPYMQNVVDIQQREAQRAADIAGTQRGAQAVQSGAFGGSRQAIMEAEAARNLATQKGDIQAQGSNLAFQQAQQQYNADQARRMQAAQQTEQSRQFGAGVGMQGLQTALSAAGQYGTLAGQEFQQGMDVNRLQSAYGAQQQALRQQGLTQSYEDFQRQQQDPYNKLSFMSSMVRGVPGMTTNTVGTTPNPSFLQSAGSLALGAYGLKNFFAEGGSVDSQQNIEDIVRKLSDKQLEQAQQSAKARGDGVQLQVIAMEQASRASMKRGIGAIPVDTEKMARGGIVAFKDRGFVSSNFGEDEEGYNPNASPSSDTDVDATLEDTGPQGAGNPEMYSTALNEGVQAESAVRNAKRTPFTPEMRAAQIKRTRAELMEGMGPSPYEAQRKEFEQMKADSAESLKQGKGIAALRAAGAMLKGGNLARGIGYAAEEFGTSYGEAVRADQAQKRALQSMRINLIDAERKEKMGLNKEAIASANQAQKDQNAADVFEIDKNKALANLAYRKAAATKPGPAAKAPLPPKLAEQLAAAEIAFEKNPNDPEAKANVMGLRRAAAATRTSFSTSEAGPEKLKVETTKLTQSKEEKEAERVAKEEADIAKTVKPLLDPAYQAAMAKGDQAGMAAAIDKLRAAERARRKKAVGNNSPAPTTAPARMRFDASGNQIP